MGHTCIESYKIIACKKDYSICRYIHMVSPAGLFDTYQNSEVYFYQNEADISNIYDMISLLFCSHLKI